MGTGAFGGGVVQHAAGSVIFGFVGLVGVSGLVSSVEIATANRDSVSIAGHLRPQPRRTAHIARGFAARFEAVFRSRWSRFPASSPPQPTPSLVSLGQSSLALVAPTRGAPASRQQPQRCGGGGRLAIGDCRRSRGEGWGLRAVPDPVSGTLRSQVVSKRGAVAVAVGSAITSSRHRTISNSGNTQTARNPYASPSRTPCPSVLPPNSANDARSGCGISTATFADSPSTPATFPFEPLGFASSVTSPSASQ